MTDRPTTAVEAADTLERLSSDRLLPFTVSHPLLENPADHLAPSQTSRIVRGWPTSVSPTLPPVLVGMPLFDEVGQTWIGSSTPLFDSDHQGPRIFDAQTPHRNLNRYRTVVLSAPEAAGVSPYGSRALVVSYGRAQAAAAALDRWSVAGLGARQAHLVEAEAGVYRDYAAAVQAAIPQSFDWALELSADPPPEAQERRSSWR